MLYLLARSIYWPSTRGHCGIHCGNLGMIDLVTHNIFMMILGAPITIGVMLGIYYIIDFVIKLYEWASNE